MAHAQRCETHLHCAHVAPEATRDGVGLSDPIERCLARTSRGKRRRVGRELQMAENLADHLDLGDGGDHAQRSLTAQGTRGHRRELGQRLGVPVALLPYPNPGALADAAPTGVWDVGFLGAEPQRAHAIDFTAAYVEIEATYLVPPGSPLTAIADVDRPGIRIAVADRSAGADNTFKRFVADKLDALAGLRPRLITDQENLPGSRLLLTFRTP
jgi:hypothetical protein